MKPTGNDKVALFTDFIMKIEHESEKLESLTPELAHVQKACLTKGTPTSTFLAR